MTIRDILVSIFLSYDGMFSYGLWILATTFLFLQYLEKREHFWVRYLVCAGALLLCCHVCISRMMVHPALILTAFLIVYFLDVLCVLLCCRVSVTEAFACALYGLLTEHTINVLYTLLYPSSYAVDLIYLALGALVMLLIWSLIARKMALDGHYPVQPGHIAILCVICVGTAIGLSYVGKQIANPYHDSYIRNEVVRNMLRITQVYDGAFCVTVLATQLLHARQMQMQKRLQIGRELMRLQEEQYRLTRDNIDLINRKCHDMKHQIALLVAQSEGSGDSIDRYGREIEQMINIYDTGIDTKNEVLNTVLMDKSLHCSMNGINWSCAAYGEDLGFMEPMDLVCLVGNALDNAVEAVEQIQDPKKRIIQVEIVRKGNFVHMVVENSFAGEIRWQNGVPATSKENNGYHGFGVGNITAIAEKYKGSAQIKTEDNIFTLSVLLPIAGES